MSLPALVRRTDKDCSKKDNKDSQLCATGESTSAWEVCLAVILPVFFIGVILGYFAWRAYKKNKKEALEDDDPDFNGDNIVLPDIIEDKDSDQGRYRTPGANPFKYANSSSVQIPQKAAKNPFGDSKAYEAGYDMNQKIPPSYMYNHAENMSQTSFPRTLHNHDPVESIVLPYAEETVSKRSLEELSRQLGGDYGGYRVPERKLESESASVMQSIASRSNVSGNSRKSADLGGGRLNVDLAERGEAERGNRGETRGHRSEGDGKDGKDGNTEDRVDENEEDIVDGNEEDRINGNAEDREDRIDGNVGNREDGNKENTLHSKTTSSAQRTTYSISIPARATARGLGNVPQALESAEQDPGSRNEPPAAYGDPRQAHNTARTMLMRGNVQKSQSSAPEGPSSAHFGYPDGTVATTADTYTSSSGEYSPDNYHNSDIGSSDVDRTNTMQSMSQMTYQTPNESVESSPDVPDAGKRVPYVSVEQEGYTNCEEFRETDGEHAGEDTFTPENSTPAPAGRTARVRSQIGRKQLIGGGKTESEAGENAENAENAEEEEQIDRMKSVYKVYFSRDSSIMSRNSRSEYKFDATGADVPPLPEIAFPNKEGEESDGEYVNLDSKRNVKGDINEGINGGGEEEGETEGEKYEKDDQKYQKYQKYDQQYDDKSNQNLSTINETTSNPPQRPALTVDTTPENRMSTASYSSSIYVPATTPNPNEGYYPHQQMQYMMEQQRQEQKMQVRMMQQQQQMMMAQGYAYAPQQQMRQQMQAPRIPQKKLEKLPSPHQFSNRNSTLETFIEFNDKRKLPQKGVIASPHINPNLSQMPWSQTPSNPSPHQIDESMLIHSPVEITGKKRYMPPGSFENQIRKASPNMNRSASQFSPQMDDFQPGPASGFRPQAGNVGI